MEDICVKLFHLMRKVNIRCFYTLKVREKTDLSSGWVWFWGRVFRPWIGLLWFLRCFGFKIDWKTSFYQKKKHKSRFFGHHNDWNLSKTGNPLSIFFFRDRRYVIHSKHKLNKKRRFTWPTTPSLLFL